MNRFKLTIALITIAPCVMQASGITDQKEENIFDKVYDKNHNHEFALKNDQFVLANCSFKIPTDHSVRSLMQMVKSNLLIQGLASATTTTSSKNADMHNICLQNSIHCFALIKAMQEVELNEATLENQRQIKAQHTEKKA